MWTEKARTWRKKAKRGVSPIIATILLVAITVVLAAVLYILISGLTKGPGSTPLGTTFAWGPTNNVTKTGAVGCTGTDFCYSLEIVPSSSTTLTANSMSFTLRTTAGGAAAFAGTAKVTLVNLQGVATTAVWTPAAGWAAGSTPLASGETMVVDNGAAIGLFGSSVVAVGANGFSGEVASSSLS